MLARLGVFQGGAFEDDFLADHRPRRGPGRPRERRLARAAAATGVAALVEAETVPGVGPPFLRFHPTLAPMLWQQLDPEERTRLTAAHRQRYQHLANFLYVQDSKNPREARAIARRELPNLLYAVAAAFAAQDPDAVEFADSVTRFLNIFGLPREAERLTALCQTAASEEGSRAWVIAQWNRGEQLRAAGRATEAAEIFRRILDRLGDAPQLRAGNDARPARPVPAGNRTDRPGGAPLSGRHCGHDEVGG